MNPKLDERKVAFIVQSSMFRAYTGTRINAATQIYPIQAFMWLSAYLKTLKLETSVFDMGVMDQRICWQALVQFLLKEKPKFIGITVTTPIYYEAKLIGIVAKQVLGPDVIVIHGGIHASSLPEESLTESMCDVVVVGEGEITFGELCQGKPFKEIMGVVYREDNGRRIKISANEIIRRLSNGEAAYYVQKDAVESDPPDIRRTLPRPLMKGKDLDNLPFIDMELYDIWAYKNPKIIAKSHPLIQYETSRGCPFTCNFCSAEDQYRVISPDRVIETLKYFKHCGIKELRISDDQFLTHVKRGKVIAEKMLQAGLKFDINLGNGVRADRCDEEFLRLFKRVGLYQLGAGFESGDQESLDSIQKSLDIQKSLEIMTTIRRADIEVVGFFMFGTPKDTFKSMQKTIDFAKLLRPDYAKVTICIPFPDTRLYKDYDRRGLIVKPERWDLYNIHKSVGVYKHPNPDLTPEVLTEWYWKFYKEFYGDIRYLGWKGWKCLWNGSLPRHVYYGAKTFFPNLIPGNPMDNLIASYKSKKI